MIESTEHKMGFAEKCINHLFYMEDLNDDDDREKLCDHIGKCCLTLAEITWIDLLK